MNRKKNNIEFFPAIFVNTVSHWKKERGGKGFSSLLLQPHRFSGLQRLAVLLLPAVKLSPLDPVLIYKDYYRDATVHPHKQHSSLALFYASPVLFFWQFYCFCVQSTKTQWNVSFLINKSLNFKPTPPRAPSLNNNLWYAFAMIQILSLSIETLFLSFF